ncbi:MAG: hypothetical protein JWO86_5620 [Myxococcaceae bacterium]|jgi:hypothetical protein|nr:hypothetical protein [Myxococcaceae bacterium]MEA2747053.1 hypothetical protein [Myxococcales bacterium]
MISFDVSVRALLGALVLGALAVACGSSSDGGTTTDSAKTCSPDTTPASELASPAVSFETDVAPILAKSCAFSSCHGSHGTGNHGVFLAATGTDGMSAVKTSLAGASHALPSMKYVVPGDVENSFVLRKLDGSLCGLDAQCVGGSCGTSMPEGNDLLPQASRDLVRKWIAQGAK